MRRPNFMAFGPPIPVVPVGDFSRMDLTPEQWADAWSLCGPSAERNMMRGFNRGPLELWQVIASAYLEGLAHGAGIERENNKINPLPSEGKVLLHWAGGEADGG